MNLTSTYHPPSMTTTMFDLKSNLTGVAEHINNEYGLMWDADIVDAVVQLYYDPEIDEEIYEFCTVFAEHSIRLLHENL